MAYRALFIHEGNGTLSMILPDAADLAESFSEVISSATVAPKKMMLLGLRNQNRTLCSKKLGLLAEGLGRLREIRELVLVAPRGGLFEGNNGEEEDGHTPPSTTEQLFSHAPQIQRVQILDLPSSLSDLVKALNAMPSLNEVNIDLVKFRRNRISSSSIDVLANKVIKVKDTIRSFTIVGGGLELPSSVYSLVARDSLKRVNLLKCKVTDSQCRLLSSCLLQRTKILHRLGLVQECEIDSSGLSKILATLKYFKKRIRHLILGSSLLRVGGVCQDLANVISANNQSMKCLSLATVSDSAHFDPELLLPVFIALKKNVHLTRISFGSDKGRPWNDRVATEFSSLLASGNPFQQIYLRGQGYEQCWNKIGPALAARSNCVKGLSFSSAIGLSTAVELASYLRFNTSLEELGIEYESKNSPEEDRKERALALVDIIEGLGHNTTLTSLRLISNHDLKKESQGRYPSHSISHGEDMEKRLVKAISKNYGLVELRAGLKIETNPLVSSIFNMNRAGRKYLLSDPSNKDAGVTVLSAVSDSLDGIYFHLSENPGLCNMTQSSGKRQSLNESGQGPGPKRIRIA